MKWLSIVRFVPDPGRGEFINVAAIAGDDENEETEMRAVSNWARAKKLDDDGSLAAVMHFVSNLQARIDECDGFLARSELTEISERLQNIVQVTQPMPVATTSLSNTIDIAFDEIIVDPSGRARDYFTKRKAQGKVSKAYARHNVNYTKDAAVRSGPYTTNFDFAVANGKAVQLVRCWSFQLPNQDALAEELRAWAWGVRAMRHAVDSELLAPTTALRVPKGVDVAAVFVPPKDPEHVGTAFRVAEAAFQDADVNVDFVSQDEADQVAEAATSLLHASASLQ